MLLLAGPLRAQPPPADETKPPEEAPPPPPPQPQPGAQPQPGTGPGTGAALPQLPPTEAELARGKRIARVEIVGNRRISNDEMRAIVKWLRVGKAFNPRGMTRDVRELWDTGYFDDIEVDLTKKGDDEVEVRILVRERPSIKEIEISGASAVDEDDIKEEAEKEVKTGSIISHAAIRKAVQRIRDKYAEEGYFLAEAHYEILPRKDNQVVIRFTVREHEKVTVRRVTFIGNYSIPSEDLRDLMITGKQDLFSFGSGGPFRQDAFERDVLIISSHYYDNGFLSVQVAAPRVMLTPDRSGIEIVITIDEGPRYKIRRLSVSEVDADGREIEPIGGRRKLREMIRAEPGEWFNRAELVKDLSDIQTMYRDHGYANVDAPPQTKLYPNTQEVDVIIKIRRGELVRFGRIEVRGNTKTRDKVIRRELEIAEGELFSETGLEESRKRIAALGYFERVDFNTEASERKGRVDVNIEVTEKPTGTFQIGAGFSSIESFIATAQVQQANLFGNGQSLAILAQLSGLRQLIDVRLIEPYFLDSPFSLQLNGFKQLRVFNQFALDSTGGSITFGYPLIDPELTASLTYTLKNDEIDTQTRTTFFGTAGAISVFQRLPIANLFQDGITSSIRPALAYDTRDNRLFPTSGVYLQGSSEFAHTVFGSDNVFFRHKVVGRFYYPITPTVVLKFQGEGGLVHNPTVPMDANDTAGVPLFARDFLGGIFDLRGFKLRSVGPRLPLTNVLDPNAAPIEDGAVIGGNLSYFQNLEVEFPIIQQVGLRGVVFTDLGNAWNLEDVYCKAAPSAQDDVTDPCFEFVDIFNVRTSWGFGLRWFSPLGPLRFEWGFPFKPLDYEDRSVFEFTIGNFF
ncbi:MAG TPA: outer membrane protein assembly factor BamA [Polyangiaceae bacterium]|nr:outer membrane protein assembly factor BamA [Polyangiaceae bacterium]